MKRNAVISAAMLIFAGSMFLPFAAFGQASSSSDAVGTVVDRSGASVSGATVHVSNNTGAAWNAGPQQ